MKKCFTDVMVAHKDLTVTFTVLTVFTRFGTF